MKPKKDSHLDTHGGRERKMPSLKKKAYLICMHVPELHVCALCLCRILWRSEEALNPLELNSKPGLN